MNSWSSVLLEYLEGWKSTPRKKKTVKWYNKGYTEVILFEWSAFWRKIQQITWVVESLFLDNRQDIPICVCSVLEDQIKLVYSQNNESETVKKIIIENFPTRAFSVFSLIRRRQSLQVLSFLINLCAI